MANRGLGSSKVHDDRSAVVNYRACGLVWSMLVALGAIDPGSNPGRPTKTNVSNGSRQMSDKGLKLL